jgi:hypothetical protein
MKVTLPWREGLGWGACTTLGWMRGVMAGSPTHWYPLHLLVTMCVLRSAFEDGARITTGLVGVTVTTTTGTTIPRME